MKRAAEQAAASPLSAKRVKAEEKHTELTATFDDLNSDCLVNILSCLPNDGMNSVSECSKSCREARANDSLDQTRTGTIVCTESTTLESIRNAFVSQEWGEVFSGNRTRMKVVGLEGMPRIGEGVQQSPFHVLPNVSSLDLSYNSFGEDNTVSHRRTKLKAFAIMLPNLEEIDLSHTTLVPSLMWINALDGVCTNLRRVIWNSSEKQVTLSGSGLPRTLTEVYLDNSVLFSSMDYIPHSAQGDLFMFRYCSHLQRLSILNVSWGSAMYPETTHPVTQEMLIKMIRRHPTLRWLRSDLTEENIAMFQQERPDITFVGK